MIHVRYFIKTSVGSPLPPTSDTVASFVLFVSFYFSHHDHQYKCENGGGEVFKWELENECSVQGHSHSKHPTTFNWPKRGVYVTPIMHMAGAQAQYPPKPPFQVRTHKHKKQMNIVFFFNYRLILQCICKQEDTS